MQNALDRANKAGEEKDATIAAMHQQLGEMEDKWVGTSCSKKAEHDVKLATI